ncbi:hypothetical protein Tco_1228281 [Tanacetum coccineum]
MPRQKPLVKDGDADDVDVLDFKLLLRHQSLSSQEDCLDILKAKDLTLGSSGISRDSPFELVVILLLTYYWSNFLIGSLQLEVVVPGAKIPYWGWLCNAQLGSRLCLKQLLIYLSQEDYTLRSGGQRPFKFAEMQMVVAFLEKTEERDRFAKIIDFLKASSVSYALTVNPIIYTSCIEQFWATSKVQTVNAMRQLQALVDKKGVIVTESSIRRDLHLDDGSEQKVDGKDEQSKKPDDSTASIDYSTTGEAVTTASIDDSAVPTTNEEITLAQTLIQIKEAKPQSCYKLMITQQQLRGPNDRGGEEQKLARKQEEEANIALIESWENTQAMMEVDRLLAERLQLKEREELRDEEKAKLFMELMEKRRKHFAALRAQEKRNRPPTKAQKRTQMSTYLKHMGGYTYKQLKGKSFDEIQKLFDKEMKRVNTFVAMGSEVQESKEKNKEGREETTKGGRKKMHGKEKERKEQQKESSKKQKVEEEKESEEVDEVELKKLLVIKKDEDIAIDAIPLATKLPVIIDYKLHKEGLLVHYELIRADRSSKRDIFHGKDAARL